MLKILTNPTFRVDVDAVLDGPPQVFTAVVRALPEADITGFDVSHSEGFKEFLRAVVIRLEGLVDDEDKPVSYTPELLELLIDWPHLRNAINRAYWKGLFKARAGN